MADLTWTKVEPSWDIDKVRKEAAKLILEYKMAMSVADREDRHVIEKMQNVFYSDITKEIKHKQINTPIALVRYLAELAVNLGGSSVSIAGDDTEASIQYDELPGLEKIKDRLDLNSPESRKYMTELYRSSLNRFSFLLGFKADVELDFDKPLARLTFRK